MKAEYTAEDFKRGVKNPYFEKLNRKVEVAVKHEDYQVFLEVAEQNGVKPEVIMNRCLADYAKRLREHDE
ncbi:MAG: hypothetical protein FWC55_06630 [Firmicutes bacterium]|nr:hypothetical protein [Bacillota bacterium]